MKTRTNYLFSLLLVAFVAFSCAKNEEVVVKEASAPCEKVFRVIPVDEALNTLENFLEETDMAVTKSGIQRTYSAAIPHYSDQTLTKSGEEVPDAYLVNFDDNQGFAILGANTNIAPIIAVVKQGNTDWETLLPQNAPETKACEDEPDELLAEGMSPEQIMTACVSGALSTNSFEEEVRELDDETGGGGGGGSKANVNIGPLMGSNFQFSQNETYCHKGNNHRFVVNGCASTAIAMVMAYNQYPRFTVDYSTIDYSKCDTKDGIADLYFHFNTGNVYVKYSDYFKNYSAIPSSLTDAQKRALIEKIDSDVIDDHGTPTVYNNRTFYRTRFKLTSGVYYKLNCVINNWNGTGAMPNAVVNGLEDLGYTNVDKTKKKSLTNAQINTIQSMLSANKPVIMCGWSLFELSQSHYWVVDGLRKSSSQTLICCNWGHSGSCDGWFASDCIRESASDRVATKGGSNNNNGWNNIIVFSYNKKSTVPSKSVNTFYSDHRATY